MSTASLRRRPDTRAWQIQVWISFALAALLCGTGLAWLPVAPIELAFMLMAYVFCLCTVFALAKFVRDRDAGLPETPAWGLVVWGGRRRDRRLTLRPVFDQKDAAGVEAHALASRVKFVRIIRRVMNGEETRDWNPETNTVAGGDPGELLGLVRYEHWIRNFHMAQAFDPLYPDEPSAIARKFALEREMPETEVEKLMVDLLESPVRKDIAAFMTKKLGRKLEPFDIYFDDIVEAKPAAELNAAVKTRFADLKDFERKLPIVLRELGFSAEDADFLGTHIRVEFSKGAGHAMRPELTGYAAWLRT